MSKSKNQKMLGVALFGLILFIIGIYMGYELYDDYITDYKIDTGILTIIFNVILLSAGYALIKIGIDNSRTILDPDSLDQTKTIMNEDI